MLFILLLRIVMPYYNSNSVKIVILDWNRVCVDLTWFMFYNWLRVEKIKMNALILLMVGQVFFVGLHWDLHLPEYWSQLKFDGEPDPGGYLEIQRCGTWILLHCLTYARPTHVRWDWFSLYTELTELILIVKAAAKLYFIFFIFYTYQGKSCNNVMCGLPIL